MLNVFSKNDMAEIVLVKLNYKETLKKAKENHDIEQERNNYFNEMIKRDPSEENLTNKMNSDKLLLELMQNISEATEGLKKKEAQYIAGALVVKYLNRVSVITSGFDNYFTNLYPFYFLYSNMIERYKTDYDYIDLNGFVENAGSASEHQETNEFKLGFKPNLYEFIGEFDIIFDEFKFKSLQSKDLVAQEFKSQKLS
jgi:lipid II:glycine glycyltransferase (peptidoglycan interpeptide bridge formation enzyme)